jgi:hypothetical protein
MSAFQPGPFGRRPKTEVREQNSLASSFVMRGAVSPRFAKRLRRAIRLRSKRIGGAERDRTDDLKLAKLALSQLSYSPPMSISRLAAPGVACGR